MTATPSPNPALPDREAIARVRERAAIIVAANVEDVHGFPTIVPAEQPGADDYAKADAILALSSPNAALVEALREAEGVLSDVEHQPFHDPDHQAEIAALGSRIGYGALMAGASAAWADASSVPGGQFVAGPCHAVVVRTLKTIRAALAAAKQGGA